jgi:hypothetical protein
VAYLHPLLAVAEINPAPDLELPSEQFPLLQSREIVEVLALDAQG